MKTVHFPYGKQVLSHAFEDDRLLGVLTSSIEEYTPQADPVTLVERALDAPIGSAPLQQLAVGKQNIVIIASDHTRPVPSRVIMPAMLERIRRGNPRANITILISTGCHRPSTREELVHKFGEEIVQRETIVNHVCGAAEDMVSIGTLPSGGECRINRIAAQADLLVAEGFIEPHLFAGFSGGRKSVLPGVCSRETVMYNHCSEFIAHPCSRTGILENNPIHRDMVWAARQAGLAFICNVVLDACKEVIYAVAGDMELAHREGTDFLTGLCGAPTREADIVISTNGGYPLDQNVYQSVKGMTAAEAAVRKDGVIIMLSACSDGTGSDHFYHQLADEPDLERLMARFLAQTREETEPDQWQTQILVRILLHARVIMVSRLPDEMIRAMHMIPADSIADALEKAKQLLGNQAPTIVAIPDGISVAVTKKG